MTVPTPSSRSPGNSRTVLTAKILVESEGTAAEHKRLVDWAATRFSHSAQYPSNGAVTVQVLNEEGAQVAFSSYGSTPSQDTLSEVFDLDG